MRTMTPNIGETDIIVRFVIGLLLLGAAFGLHDAGNTPASMQPWGWIGLYPLLTVLTGHCWLYRLRGIDTRAKANKPK